MEFEGNVLALGGNDHGGDGPGSVVGQNWETADGRDILDDGEIMEAPGVGPGTVEVSRVEIVQTVLGDESHQLFEQLDARFERDLREAFFGNWAVPWGRVEPVAGGFV